ncbi:MAG: hypothetical protein ABIV51_14430 [Saprospiraceae bacterium]
MVVYVLGGLIAYLIATKYFKDFNPGDKRVNSDIGHMKEYIADQCIELVPWNEQDADLLAFNHQQKVKSVGFGKQIKGHFKSIYQENMFAYAYKEYPGSRSDRLLLVQTASHELVYRIKKDIVQIYFDTQPLGHLTEEILYQAGTNKVIGHIGGAENDMFPIFVAERRIAYINDPKMSKTSVNPRVFNFMIPWTKDEEKIFLALVFHKIVSFYLPKDKTIKGQAATSLLS